MNDSMSILLATTILALGGLGLYIYKSTDDKSYDDTQKGDEEDYNEENIFGGNFWNLSDDKGNNDEDIDENLQDEEDYKPRKKNTKTQRNRKTSGTSRRRY